MSAQDENTMVRKQFHLSKANVHRIEAIRDELGLGSDAQVIRYAIESFDTDALEPAEREMVEATANELRSRIETLSTNIEATIERAQKARAQLHDPSWVEEVRQQTRREAETDPALVDGVVSLIGASP